MVVWKTKLQYEVKLKSLAACYFGAFNVNQGRISLMSCILSFIAVETPVKVAVNGVDKL